MSFSVEFRLQTISVTWFASCEQTETRELFFVPACLLISFQYHNRCNDCLNDDERLHTQVKDFVICGYRLRLKETTFYREYVVNLKSSNSKSPLGFGL